MSLNRGAYSAVQNYGSAGGGSGAGGGGFNLKEIITSFAPLGFIAFGGPQVQLCERRAGRTDCWARWQAGCGGAAVKDRVVWMGT